VGSPDDDELWSVPGFADIGIGEDVVAAVLQASHMLPPDRLSDLLRRAGMAIGADDVSMWLIDYGQAVLTLSDHGDDLAPGTGTIPVTGTIAGRAFTRSEAIESDQPNPHRWVPLLDGTERLGVLRFDFTEPLTEQQRRLSDAVASLGGELLVAKRPHTDRYEMQRRRAEMNLAAELQWRQFPPLESSIPTAAVAGFVEPAYGVGGDGFDYSINGDVIDLTIYDAVGHGLHSALLSTLMIASLRHSRRVSLALPERLAFADEAISSQFHGDFVTAQVAQLSTTSGKLCWANAGHPLPMLVRGGIVVGELTYPPRPPVGIDPRQCRDDRRHGAAAAVGSRAVLHRWARRGRPPRRIQVRCRAAGRPVGTRSC
jgi:hypothetical protein